jgi:hypothetical protein
MAFNEIQEERVAILEQESTKMVKQPSRECNSQSELRGGAFWLHAQFMDMVRNTKNFPLNDLQ